MAMGSLRDLIVTNKSVRLMALNKEITDSSRECHEGVHPTLKKTCPKSCPKAVLGT